MSSWDVTRRADLGIRVAVSTNVPPPILHAYLAPLAAMSEVSEVIIIRDRADVSLGPKTRIVSPPSWWPRGLVVKLLTRRVLFWWVGRTLHPTMIMVVHWFPDGPATARWARRLRVPLVSHIIGGRAELVDGGRRIALSPIPRLLKRFLQRYQMRWLKVSAVTTVTGEETRRWYTSLGLPDDRAITLHALISAPMPSVMAKVRDVDVAFIGRADRDKRVDRLFQVLSVICESRRDLTATIIGVAQAEVEGTANFRLAREAMGDRLVLVKRVERVEDVLIRSKVLCVTSDTEGRTLAVLEAFMSGAAVVATGVGDLAEVVDGSGGGVTVPPNQDESVLCTALATAVQGLLDNEPRRAAAADRGRSFVREAHSFTHSQADWKRILDAARLVAHP